MIQGTLTEFMDFGSGYFHPGEQVWFDGTDLELGEALESGNLTVQFGDGIKRGVPGEAVEFLGH